MRRRVAIACAALLAGGLFLARGGMQPPQPQTEGEKKIIDLKSDLSGPIAPGDSVIFLVGNFAAQHNGAVITCDSAVRYSDRRIEFFGNVLINKNTTYIYGERADYNGDENIARVYSDLVKVVDGDAVLYTYKFEFNTKDNIGRFDEGGAMTNRDSRLESIRGYYYGDARELVCVEQVEMRNDEYELRGDSVVYNMATDNAQFFERTNIWNKDGDYLYADRGEYVKADSLYKVTRNGYVLTEKQEVWSDTIDYYRAVDHVVLRRDVQIDDTEHKVLAFGDYGEYWKEPGNAFLTRRPAVVSYDLRQNPDTLFMRADSIFLYTVFNREPEMQADSTALLSADSLGMSAAADSLSLLSADSLGSGSASHAESPAAGSGIGPDARNTLSPGVPVPGMPSDSLQRKASAPDSLAVAAADSVQLTPAERKAQLKEATRKAAAEKKAAAAKAKKAKLDEIAARRREKTNAKLLAQKEKEEARLEARRRKAEAKLRARQARAARKGKVLRADSAALEHLDSLIGQNAALQDSLVNLLADSLAADSLSMPLAADSLDSLAAPRDSLYRLVKGYRNVKVYRSDFQTVCDSLVAISTDSTIHLYIDPVLWNQQNQITSDVMDIFTENQQIVRAEFIGSPMMVSLIDTAHYNQVAGKTMTAFFRDNEIYRNDVNGNAQTLYFMQDGEPPQITMMGVVESGSITFYIEQKQVVRIAWHGNPVYHFYPLDKIPPEQSLYLKGFKWEGARRPTQAEVFDRTVRPSERERRSRLRHPDFPIMQRIEEYKKRLIEERRWVDREDEVDAATVEWMRTLGYEVGQPR